MVKKIWEIVSKFRISEEGSKEEYIEEIRRMEARHKDGMSKRDFNKYGVQ